jgi:hypothetical protein
VARPRRAGRGAALRCGGGPFYLPGPARSTSPTPAPSSPKQGPSSRRNEQPPAGGSPPHDGGHSSPGGGGWTGNPARGVQVLSLLDAGAGSGGERARGGRRGGGTDGRSRRRNTSELQRPASSSSPPTPPAPGSSSRGIRPRRDLPACLASGSKAVVPGGGDKVALSSLPWWLGMARGCAGPHMPFLPYDASCGVRAGELDGCVAFTVPRCGGKTVKATSSSLSVRQCGQS